MNNIEIYQKLSANIEKVIQGQTKTIRQLLAAFLSGGHVLLEDVPGTGKTTLAKTLAKSIDAEFQRIQFTPDLLPTDILGVSIFRQNEQDFEFCPGPIFSNILLADEINRAAPRTQSALLESMGEEQVSIERQVYKLNELFFVIATQNPIEYHGTYPLPEAQLDRFQMRLSLGYISQEEEVNMLEQQNSSHPLDNITACTNKDDIIKLKQQIHEVQISRELKNYIVSLIRATREHEEILNGASPRATLALTKAAKALALFAGQDYVTPEHIQELAVPVIAHRLTLHTNNSLTGAGNAHIVKDILENTSVPV